MCTPLSLCSAKNCLQSCTVGLPNLLPEAMENWRANRQRNSANSSSKAADSLCLSPHFFCLSSILVCLDHHFSQASLCAASSMCASHPPNVHCLGQRYTWLACSEMPTIKRRIGKEDVVNRSLHGMRRVFSFWHRGGDFKGYLVTFEANNFNLQQLIDELLTQRRTHGV